MSQRALNEIWEREMLGDVRAHSLGNSGSVPQPDCAIGEVQQWIVNANAVVAAPLNTSGVAIGSHLYMLFQQNATGGFTLGWNAIWRNAPTLAAGAANTRASFEFRWDGTSMQFVGGSTAF